MKICIKASLEMTNNRKLKNVAQNRQVSVLTNEIKCSKI